MCFLINPRAKRPESTRVYKVLRAYHNDTTFYSPQVALHEWTLGETKELTVDKTFESHDGFGDAKQGYYVFASRQLAFDSWYFDTSDSVVVELEVDPADWLHTSTDGEMRTYRKVKLLRVVLRQTVLERFAEFIKSVVSA